MRCIVALIFCILCIFSGRVIAADKQQIIPEEEGTCSNGDGDSAWTTLQKIIFYDVNDGSLTINSQTTYTKPFRQFGVDVAVQLREIVKNVQSLGLLSDDNSDDHKMHKILSLSNDLLALAAVHRLEWLHGSSNEAALQSDSFDKTVIICKAVLRLFNLVQSHITNEEEIEYISTGVSSTALLIGDLFMLRPSMDLSAVAEDDYSTAYQYFNFAEKKMVKSLSAMGIDRYGNSVTNEHESNNRQEDDMDFLDGNLSVLAEINLRFGSLLLEMHLLGFTLDQNNNLHHHVPSAFDIPMQQLSDDQKYTLHKALEKLETSTVIYKKLKFSSDVLLSQADAYSRMGSVNSLLHEWALSVKNCKKGLSMLSSVLSKGETVDEILTTMIATTQTIFEAYLHIPGEIESTKDAYRMHLLARQAAEVGDVKNVFDKKLRNEDEEDVRQLLLLKKDATLPIVDSAQVRESLAICIKICLKKRSNLECITPNWILMEALLLIVIVTYSMKEVSAL